jgi:hypothetical protein
VEAVSKFQQWYFLNGHKLNARRAFRYQNDPAYRERVLAPQRAQNKVKAAQRQYKTTIFGQTCRAYKIGEASAQIGKRSSTIRQWESTGLIPLPIFPQRFYTLHQVHLMRDIAVMLALSGARHTDHAKVREAIAAHKIKIYQQWND